MEPEQIEEHPEIDDWAQWVRQKLRIDTSAWVTPDMAGKEYAVAHECANDFGSALRQPATLSPFSKETCNHTRKLLTHRLDVGGAITAMSATSRYFHYKDTMNTPPAWCGWTYIFSVKRFCSWVRLNNYV